jgi:hypothetical protein
MAVNNESWFSNALVGVPQVGADVNIYEEHTTPRFAVGTKFERQDGAIFRYAHFGATVASAGLMCHVDMSESAIEGLTPLLVVASSSTYQMANEQPGVYPNMKDSKYVVITKGSVTADDYAGGYITMSSGNAATSHTYRIKGNTATGDPASGKVRFELCDKLQVGLSSSTGFMLAPSRWANLEAGLPSTGSDLPSGVSMVKITTADDYGWVQTKGICGILAGETTILANRPVAMSTEVAGAVDLFAVSVSALTSTAYSMTPPHPIVGFAVTNCTAGTFVPIVLNID